MTTLTLESFLRQYPEKRKRIQVKKWADLQDGTCTIFCKIHKIEYAVRRRQLKVDSCGCPKCKHENYSRSAKIRIADFGHPTQLTNGELSNRIRMDFPEIEIKTRLNMRNKYNGEVWKFKHSCGTIWETKARKLIGCAVGCPKCAKLRQGGFKKTLEQYTAECLSENDGQIKPLEYFGDSEYALHECQVCRNTFRQIPNRILSSKKHYCPHCKNTSNAYSPIATRWLREINATCKSATNGGEHVVAIGNKRLRVDGFDARKKAVYEFLGDCWHGNPTRYRPRSKPHPYSDKTAAKLLRETMDRLSLIASATNCKVVYVWESDFRSGKLKSGIIYP